MDTASRQEYRVKIIGEIVAKLKELCGSTLRQVILFGSYACGEQDEYSDMDIMVLVDELAKYRRNKAEKCLADSSVLN